MSLLIITECSRPTLNIACVSNAWRKTAQICVLSWWKPEQDMDGG